MVQQKSQFEFIALMASLMSLVALAIDALLPALAEIGTALNVVDSNDTQLLVTMIFLGLGVGQLISGPLSDSIGRKPVIYFGFVLYILASFVCTSATSIEMMIVGRLLQGIGLSAPRTISVAIVRDSFSGNNMAKIMSFVMAIFILVPAIAPALGKFVLDAFDWKSIFHTQAIFSTVVVLWFGLRQKETLSEQNKIKFSGKVLLNAAKEFFKHRQTVVNTIIAGFISGSFMVFLSTAQKIFGIQYGKIEEFPLLFATIAITIGVSTFVNGMSVLKFGMKKLILISMIGFTVLPLIYIALYWGEPNPSIYVLLGFLMIQFFAVGFLFGNLSAQAMEPVGHIAGIGAALNGFISTIIAVPIAFIIGNYVDTTALPLFIGFFLTGIAALIFLPFSRVKK